MKDVFEAILNQWLPLEQVPSFSVTIRTPTEPFSFPSGSGDVQRDQRRAAGPQATSSTPLVWKGPGSSRSFSPRRRSDTPQHLLCFALTNPGQSGGERSHNHPSRTRTGGLEPSCPQVEPLAPLISLLSAPFPVPTAIYSTAFQHGSPTTAGSVRAGSLCRHVHPHAAFIPPALCPQSSNELPAVFKKKKIQIATERLTFPLSLSFTRRYLALTHT